MPAARLCSSCGWPVDAGYFDDARHEVVVGRERRHVPWLLWKLLMFFRAHPGQWLETEHIWDHLYSEREEPPATNTVRVNIRKLRWLIAGIPYAIAGSQGSGYKYDLIVRPQGR